MRNKEMSGRVSVTESARVSTGVSSRVTGESSGKMNSDHLIEEEKDVLVRSPKKLNEDTIMRDAMGTPKKKMKNKGNAYNP